MSMSTPGDAVEIAAQAAEDARRRLQERDVDPAVCPRLLGALEVGVRQVIAARGHGVGVSERSAYVDELLRRLNADPVVDRLPEPPRRTLALRWSGLSAAASGIRLGAYARAIATATVIVSACALLFAAIAAQAAQEPPFD